MPEIGAIAWLYAGVLIGMVVMAVVLVPIQYFKQNKQFKFNRSIKFLRKEKDSMNINFESTNKFYGVYTANVTDENGDAAELDGPLTVEIEPGGKGTFELQPDGKTVNLLSPDANAEDVTVFHIKGDADLGAGIVTIEDVVTYTTRHTMATALGGVMSAPIRKPGV